MKKNHFLFNLFFFKCIAIIAYLVTHSKVTVVYLPKHAILLKVSFDWQVSWSASRSQRKSVWAPSPGRLKRAWLPTLSNSNARSWNRTIRTISRECTAESKWDGGLPAGWRGRDEMVHTGPQCLYIRRKHPRSSAFLLAAIKNTLEFLLKYDLT